MAIPGKQTYCSLQAGRGIAAIMVVLFHTTSFLGGDARYWHKTWLCDRMGGLALGVDYFFVLSGAVILLAHRKDIGQPAALPTYFLKRFRRVYPIYWLVLAVVVGMYALRPGLGAAWQTSSPVILSGFLLVHLGTMQANLPVAWTLFHEVLFYLVFSTLLVGKRFGQGVLAVWAALSVVMLLPGEHSLYLSTYLFSPLHLTFCFGMAAAWLLKRGRVARPGLVAMVGGVLFAAAVATTGVTRQLSYPLDLLAGAGATLLLLGGARLEELRRFSVPHPLRFLGDASYAIYLIHYPFFMFATPLVYRLSLRLHAPLYVPFALLAGLAVAAGCLLHLWVERPLLWLLTPARANPVPVTALPVLRDEPRVRMSA